MIWNHIQTILRSAGMDLHNLVSVRTYLADPKYDEATFELASSSWEATNRR